MKSKQPKARAGGKLALINLRSNITKRKYEAASETSLKSLAEMIEVEFKKKPDISGPHLVLSAANTKTANKGWLNAINCRNVFAEGPNIDFLPQDSFGGKIEVWMENIEQGDSFSVQFRVVCGYNGNWKVSCSDASPIQTPIVPVFQNIDFFIPPVDNDYGMVLIALEPLFNNNGASWVFNDVVVRKVSF
jgi:hypothetical protein